MKLSIITPALSPQLNGIGDYTSRLATQLTNHEYLQSITIFTDHRSEPDPIQGVDIVKAFNPDNPASIEHLLDQISDHRPDWLLLQYNPFSYGRWGLNFHLPRALAKMRKRTASTRLAIMFHECYVPIISTKFAIMATWQRQQFKWLGRAADALMFSMDRWAQQHRSWFPGKPIFHLPVSSNIPLVQIERDQARSRLGIATDSVVLGVFGYAHPSRSFPMVRAAGKAVQAKGRKVCILYIGPDGATTRSELGDLPAIVDGPHPPEEVSKRLAAIDICLCPYSDGVSTRRGAMMAGLQHELPIVGTYGKNTDQELLAANGESMILTPSDDSNAFATAVATLANDTEQSARVSRNGLRLFNARYSWPVITTSLLSILTSSSPPSSQ